MSLLKKIPAFLTGGIGVFAISNSENLKFVLSGWIALGIILVLVIGIIIIVYRITSKVDLVELVRAWKNNNDRIKVKEVDNNKRLFSSESDPLESSDDLEDSS